MTIKTKHYVLATLLVMLLLAGGIAKVSYELYQMLGIERTSNVEVKFVGGSIELYLFNHQKTIDLTHLAEVYRERIQGILIWQE